MKVSFIHHLVEVTLACCHISKSVLTDVSYSNLYLLFFNIILLFILITPTGRSKATYRIFSYRGAHIWNYISQNVPTDVSYACFKNLVKTHILAHPIPNFIRNI